MKMSVSPAGTLPLMGFQEPYNTFVTPPLETRAAAAVDAVGTIPAKTPGFERCSRLHRKATLSHIIAYSQIHLHALKTSITHKKNQWA
jgi:hypothetical protein